jgi:predicted esterase
MTRDLGFGHVYEPPGAVPAQPPFTLLLLHGTGGNEHDLLPLGRALAPHAGRLSPRGQVLERGNARFFRRLSEGVFDLEDLQKRTHDLAEFVAAAADAYGFDPKRVVAAGFSNGANVAASLLLLRPATLAGAMLFRAMVPIVPEPLPALAGTPVLLSNGTRDPMVAPDETERLSALLRRAGADVTLSWQSSGHDLTSGDLSNAAAWLSARSVTL